MGSQRARPSKSGRNKDCCKAYKNKNTREVNKAKKIARHCKKFGLHSLNDFPADLKAAWNKIAAIVPNPTLNKITQGILT